ncbi:MAG: sugar ABC transporter substrate-binding protein [Stomatobaculum sp.]
MRDDGFFGWLPILIVCAVIALSSAALHLSGSEEQRKQIAVVVDGSAESRWVSFQAGLERGAEDQGITLNYVSTGKLRSLAEEKKLAEKEISEGAAAVILQLCESPDSAASLGSIARKAALVLVDSGAEAEGSWSCVAADDYALGEALGREIRARAEKNATVGILGGDGRQRALRQRSEGLRAALEGSGLRVVWESDGESGSAEDSEEKGSGGTVGARQAAREATIIAALDNSATERAVEYAQGLENSQPRLFGIGNSDQNVYALDRGIIESLIVVNEFNMGYQAIAAAAEQLNGRTGAYRRSTVEFRVITRDNMFDKENQKLLFPLVQ